MSLVADYSDTSSSDSSSYLENGTDQKAAPSFSKKTLLPSANTVLTKRSNAGEVFQTKYHKEEQAKKASLEQHVKMIENDEHLTTKNGRKICWNFRKGRCRFGTKCQYAHDSDLLTESPVQSPEIKLNKQMLTTATYPDTVIANDDNEKSQSAKRKRPGLGDSITPGKRVMKAYKQQNMQ